MKLVLGLGNPGRSYAKTRHNAGWWALDHLAEVWHVDNWRGDHDAEIADARLDDIRVRLIKPQTYMNLSGAVLRPYLRREGWSAANDLLVVVDEVQLPVGRFRLRASGSAGGHNGLESIENAVGNRDYPRLRIGVGPPAGRERSDILSDYVLDRMGKEDRRVVDNLLPNVCEAIEAWVRLGIGPAMTRYNRREASASEE